MTKPDHDEQTRKARAALKRVEQQSDKVFGTGNPDSDIDENDPIEIWGKRIGRGIGYALVIVLIWHLTTTYFIK